MIAEERRLVRGHRLDDLGLELTSSGLRHYLGWRAVASLGGGAREARLNQVVLALVGAGRSASVDQVANERDIRVAELTVHVHAPEW